ncbi:MAG: TnpV protein, partial [Clostridiales bacterium]|nr:TnpV protein [Clostridiales bacterium]
PASILVARVRTYNDLLLSGRLWAYLADLNEQAQARLEVIIDQMKDAEGVTEDLKSCDWWDWVQRMGNIQNRAEEIIRAEMIFNDLFSDSGGRLFGGGFFYSI